MRDTKFYTILDDIGLKTATFTAATTDLITSNSHALKNGDLVVLTTTTTLPAGLALATVYHVISATTNTFELALTNNGAPVDITDTGTGTHTWTMHDVGRIIFVADFRNVILTYDTDGGGDANMTVQFQGSIQQDAPDFSAVRSPTNQWDYIQISDLEDGSLIDGDTGIAIAGADDNRHFEANINGLRWITAIITAHSEGEVTVRAELFNNQ